MDGVVDKALEAPSKYGGMLSHNVVDFPGYIIT
jgi:hypothetical protein